ncbi:peptide chain release factor N(5)-glutamine methyltransferase [Vannielia litorea]|uniref:Release factor glutamine methyltransferase n=1 Tax=Vannielia litorea TaxID=1217970 RepID=A0A1N6FSD9_9RHOB|nr:peptide chain release factor N(5)-glutamine methyltransferase [Vannielia litorea]SIN98170.1 [protein release factor]-glutamine N5-methyltransferase [Vannielia litorea]
MSTVGAGLRRVADLLAGAGIGDAPREASMLLAEALGVERDRLALRRDELLDAEALARAEALAARRAGGEPMSHIRGWREFWGRRFKVDARVLDPRPETEVLVAAALEEPFGDVLDLGSGSGCILLTLLAERQQARGVGTDVSGAALEVARENARALGLERRAGFIETDWCAGLRGRFDLIVSNPPYIAEAEMAGLQRELAHEPRGALTDGGDGLSAYRAIAGGLGDRLAKGGRVLVEIGPTQGRAVSALFDAVGLADIRVLPDLDGRDRVVAARG